MHVPIFKTNATYDRSTDLLFEVYSEIEALEEQQVVVLRKRAVHIIKKVTRAIVQSNQKMKMKLLNEAKEQLLMLLEESYELNNAQLINGYMIDDYGTQLLRLIHYQFGKMNR